ncbi:type VI secretion system baseplate subunit TssF [Alcaligenes endophyticus]|uniref:Type VI secretion system baseplate subunit TssF n=1 Tax=Alcaligenes endophyticus TaxID=1929088 RepID=A0ABT8EFP6_9BURK|nr:type VI secretion system baseplate subunit TssF [Alcaligenes endophyticus]MCX5590250.1 type VI secretion system baseplate subunit TssF [Alcaligenes endophyticus]MDN4120086.1 type VI secretion system baseplate subunit TssF [Alcaligenes endophyticus]
MATRFNHFYTDELLRLRSHALEFAQANPAIAPMLGTVSTDPDVERLLEGVAFLNGLTRQKLDDEFPEIAQELASVLVPQFLRPLPAASMVAFAPQTELASFTRIEAGTEIAATQIDGVSCRFRTTAPVEAYPITLDVVTCDDLPDGGQALRLQFSATEDNDETQLPSLLRLFIALESSAAANLLMLLGNQLKAVHLLDAQGNNLVLSPKISFPGLAESLFPYPDNAFPAFSWFQELLFFPQKFLFFQVSDLGKGQGRLRGSKFRLDFIFNKTQVKLPQLTARDLILNVTPVVNLFRQEAEPINLNHELPEHLIVPNSAHKRHYQIYTIDKVTGYVQGDGRAKTYVPFSLLTQSGHSEKNSYRTTLRPALVGEGIDTYLTVVYGPKQVPENETLSVHLTCTNGALPASLKLGDLSKATSSSPEQFTFQNITPVTVAIDPPSGEKLLWDVISHTTLNLLSLSSADNLRGILRLYNSTCTHDKAVRNANERQINGILDLVVTREMRLFRGTMIQGQHLVMTCDENNWASTGALYLWGCVLEQFLSCYASVNSYIRFEMRDKNTGTEMTWPIRMGQQVLL